MATRHSPARAGHRRPHAVAQPLFAHSHTAAAVRLVLLTGLTAGLLSLSIPPAHAQSAAQPGAVRHSYNVPAGTLGQALNAFAGAAGVELTVDASVLQGLRSPGLSGSYTVSEGFAELLRGQDLQAVRAANGSYTLSRVPQHPSQASPAGGAAADTLPVVTVSAQADRSSPVSEGTRSYGIRATSTASKLDLSLRETPQSVTVITRQRLDDMGAQNLHEVMGDVTGVVVSVTDSERVNYVSRGYSISTYQVDGVNVNYANGYTRLATDPALYDRIEVLRGAAGQTIGAGDPSGTLNQVRKMPTYTFAGSAGVTLGSWNNRRGEIDLSGPLAFDGKIRGRVVAVKQKADSFRDWYTTDKQVFYGVLQADLGERTTVTAGYTHQDPDNAGASWGTVHYWLSDGSLANVPRSFNPAARWSRWNLKEQQSFLRVDHQFSDDWGLRLSYTDDKQKGYGMRWFGGAGYFPNADGTGKSAWYGGGDHHADGATWDLDLKGRFKLLGREHQVNFGYHHQTYTQHSLAGTDVLPADFFTDIPDWRNWDGIVPEYTRNYLGYDSSRTKGKQSAFYVSSRLAITDPLSMVVGARLSDWSQDAWTYVNATGQYNRTGYRNKNVVTPYLSMLYDVNRNLTAYASYTDVFKPQNYRDFNGNYLDPVNGKHYELGLKGEFFDKALNASVAVFRSIKDNEAEIDDSGALQPGTFDPANPPAGYNNGGYRVIPGTEEAAYRSTGKGNRMQGIELEVQGAVNRDWNLAAGFTHVQMKNKDGQAINPHLPRNTLRLRTTYRLPGDWSRLTLGGGLSWQSMTYANVNGVPTGQTGADGRAITESRRIVQNAFWLLNLSAHYQFSQNLSASLNINNVLDKKYYSRVGFYSGVTWGTPRDIRFNLRYTF
ncbi:hypothetical protein CCO03_07905 [Comamonas serinivorans]|uniref:Secretin/TonB short N-terminal domain-containing protein n=1 Tax=Comamonas serinivorans TaxID=1082851 RepID=A0A1Y0ELS1_9BURK|nr:TonB-dependent receptor [Comamonas serinivorans]ARU04605.1 hypothetical protein CCO03_07905 [Comamonas serinivorans]